MKWTEVKVTTNDEAYESITVILYDIGAEGLQIEDPRDIFLDLGKKTWECVDEELLNVDTGKIVLKAYFTEKIDLKEKLDTLKHKMEKAQRYFLREVGTIETKQVYEKDWANNWKRYYKPFKIGKKFIIKPIWEEYEKQKEDEIVIEIDPGTAFGAGTHDTTRMCIELVEKYVKEGSNVFDVGCGSGILGICAAKLNAKRCLCVDIDSNAVKVAKENIAINKLGENIKVMQGDLLIASEGKYDVIISNIIANVIIKMIPTIRKYLNNKGVFIASGIIRKRYAEVKDKLLMNGLVIVDEMITKEWVAVAVK